ncbi:hypothetical protein ACOT81_19335 [Streptomyces sp. WI04-05B]|uniref:hypothetical protein n=1 Tax=Streptomyces TaxID=1883 RepID=UPI0029C0F092|nr:MULTISPECIES: hypothetical protein [unclassified Streptomyces]
MGQDLAGNAIIRPLVLVQAVRVAEVSVQLCLRVFLENEVAAVQIGLGMRQTRQGAGNEGNRHRGGVRGAYSHRGSSGLVGCGTITATLWTWPRPGA